MSLILNKKEENLINIKFYYKINTNKYGVSRINFLDEENPDQKKEIDLGKDVQVLNTQWSLISWQTNQLISRNSLIFNEDKQQKEFDLGLYFDYLLKSCLKKWDLKDSDNNVLLVTPENIDNLNSEVASALVKKYEKYTSDSSMDGEDGLKK